MIGDPEARSEHRMMPAIHIDGRKNAFESYRARLYEYIAKRDGGAAQQTLNRLVAGIKAIAQRDRLARDETSARSGR